MPRIPDIGGVARDGHDQAQRRRRRRRFQALFNFDPDMDDLFLGPDTVQPRERARHRVGDGSRGFNRRLFLVAMSAVIAVVGFFGGSALAGFLRSGGQAPRPGASLLAPYRASASASGSPSPMVSGSQPAPATRGNQVAMAPALAIVAQHATPAMSQVPVTSPSPAATSTIAASPSPMSGQPKVTVSYTVDEQVGDRFQAEVDVTNGGSSPIADWQIVVALPDDQVTAFANATGYVSNHILLLQPASSGSAIASGSTLRVSFAATGIETVPVVCAFNNITCG
jgi:Cellulose binding domain